MKLIQYKNNFYKCSLMQSIHSNYCKLISNNQKLIELRKNKPTLLVPFKVFIYCTAGGEKFISPSGIVGNGKVIGEYICTQIDEYECEFCKGNNECYEDIRRIIKNEDDPDDDDFIIVTSNENDDPNDCELCKQSCVSFNEIKKYVGLGIGKKLYAYRITDLVIYDEPKKLDNFIKYHIPSFEDMKKNNLQLLCNNCFRSDYGKIPTFSVTLSGDYSECAEADCRSGYESYIIDNFSLIRPPQSWCYVIHIDEFLTTM